MLPVIESKSLHIKEYAPSLQYNPAKVLHQRLQAVSQNSSTCTWQIRSPGQTNLLYPVVYLHIRPTVVKSAGAYHGNDLICRRQGCALAKAMRNITLTINGANISMNPSQWIAAMETIFLAKSEAEIYFGQSGGAFEETQNDAALIKAGVTRAAGAINDYDTAVGVIGGNAITDQAVLKTFMNKLSHIAGGGILGSVITDANPAVCTGDTEVNKEGLVRTQFNDLTQVGGNGTITGLDPVFGDHFWEPLIIPPFNFYGECTTPSWSPFSHMSKAIPHFNNAQLTINWEQRFGACIYSFKQNGVANTGAMLTVQPDLAAAGVQPELILRWIQPPVSYTIPREVSLQTWYVSGYEKTLGNIATNVAGTATSDYIRLDQVPSAMFIYIQEQRAVGDNATGYGTSDGNNGTAVAGSYNDDFIGINSLQMTLNTDAAALTTQIPKEMLYRMTVENAQSLKEYPVNYKQWVMKKSVVCLRPAQIPSFNASVGTTYSTNFQVTVNYENNLRRTLNGCSLYVQLFYDRHYLTLTSSSAKFSYQNISDRASKVTLQESQKQLTGGDQYQSRL